ncbi:MAG: bifunctional UDP-N-acetylmuramoyl-tripeptide:D-alanyl-D-alanine ligase/alanine racemase [Muribaculaceae bacterium]|nr:bifunctional UDP-N-acetylmuramoyl-tripeptide:D-alanyl-D-alanine ligase/alanine racemase [Muribaculaceae bacterium]
MKYSIQEVQSMLGLHDVRLPFPHAEVSQLLTDSRSLVMPSESLFFALVTTNNDGHNYVEELYERGVRNFVIQSPQRVPRHVAENSNMLVVTDTLTALQDVAASHRRRFNIPVIAITGSRGKTTVKEWLYQLLSPDFHIVRSPRSYNSQIGVPLSLWEIDEATTLAIIEAGISTVGEMATLQAMIRPTIGVITNIGSEHNEGFSSMAEKAQEKAKILYNCDCIIYGADNQLVTHTIASLLEADVAQECAWSRVRTDVALSIRQIVTGSDSSLVDYFYAGELHTLSLPFNGDREIENAMTCLAVMLHLGITPQEIGRRMSQLTPVATRIDVIEGVNDCTVIVDGYDSDYSSLAPAVNFMMRRAGSRNTTLIMSDLKPDVYEGDELYIRVSELLRSKGVHRILGIGSQLNGPYRKYFADIAQSRFFASTKEFLEAMTQGDFENETILVKGAPGFDFEQIIHMLEVKQHQTVEQIDLNALAHNFQFFKSVIRPTTKTVGMVKASGYGTGSYEIAKTLQDRGADYLAVAVQDEGVDLRKADITMPIIVLNPSVVNYKSLFTYWLEPEIYNVEMCRQLIKEGLKYRREKPLPVHIKIDSGMHRLGFTREQLPEIIALLKDQDVLLPTSVFTHLCVADEPAQDAYTHMQAAYFTACADELQKHFDHHIMRHILNTSGIVRFPQYQMDMVRIGIGLYGIRTLYDGSESTLRPVATLQSVIISIKEWPAGTTIGYGRKGVLTRDSRIATVTIGYADGFDRHFGNGNAHMWVHGTLCPTVGNVCMDAVMIDVTDAQCKVGDTVEIFGEHIPVERLSDARQTIPYEILTSISPRVKRVYYRE